MLTDVAASPIAETLRHISAERKSGDLQVRSGRMVKTAFFDHGRLVFTASNLRKDRLGEALIDDGRITDEEFQRVSALMRGEYKRRFGEALVKAGVMDRYEVGTAVARQVRRIALSLFELTDGAAIFEERECTIPLEYMISLSIHRLLYDGIRKMKNEELVMKGLDRLDRAVVLAEVPPFPYEPKGKAVDEREILDLSQRRVTLRRLAWGDGGLTLPRLRATYAFVAAGILRDADESPAPSQPAVQTETGMFLLSALHHRPDPTLREAIGKEVKQELDHSSHFDREAWLKVARFAPKVELVKAIEEKMERYHALRDGVEESDSLRKDIDIILGRASSALRLARQAPDTAPSETAAGRRAKKEAAAALQEAVPAPAPVPASASATPARPSVDETRPPLETEGPAGFAVAEEAGTDPAARPAAPAAGSAPPDVTDPALRHQQGSVTAGAGASAFSGKAQVEHLLMEGEVRMTVADYANAVRVYDKLVKLAPKVAAFRLRLAIAMACFPRTAKLAERQFFEASRLEPANADIHYQWALYYKAMKIRSRAVAEMRTAVRLNPRHPTARKELEALSPKDSALSSLKKLFR